MKEREAGGTARLQGAEDPKVQYYKPTVQEHREGGKEV